MFFNKIPESRHKPKVIIIGAGIAGMATGSYLQMNGFSTEIFENHNLPGGCCTAWSRKGYVFDYCIEWMLGSGPLNDANLVWRELGALDGKTVRDFELFNRVVDENGRAITFYNDPERLEKHLLDIAPDDASHIKRFCSDLRKFINLDLFPPLKPTALMSTREKLKMLKAILPAFMLLWRCGATSMEAFAARIKDPLLKKSLPYIFFQDHECFPMLPYLYNMGQAYKGNAGFPQGGSLGIARSIEARYLALGGKINYRSRVTRVLVDKDRAFGIEIKNRTQFYADIVVSACDGYFTVFEMLSGKYVNKTMRKLYDVVLKEPGILYPGVISAFVGIKGKPNACDPHSTTYMLKEDVAKLLPGCMQKSLVVQHRSRYADGFAPEGSSIIHCTYLSDFDYWQNLRDQDKPSYRKKKREIGDFLIDFLDEKYPGLRDRVDIVEVATPATNRRYTGNMKGAILGWKSFTKAEDLANKLVNNDRMQLPGLSDFYLAGQWIGGGSLVRSALSGRYVAQYICHEHKRKFTVSESTASPHWDDNNLGQMLGLMTR